MSESASPRPRPAALPAPAPRRSGRPAVRLPWHQRLADLVAGYLPLLLMTAVALGTWWLVRQTPLREPPREVAALPGVPDYTMQGFALQRFGADGRLRLQLEGRELRHYAHDDTIVVEEARLQAHADDGARMRALARHATSDDQGHQVDLRGGVQVMLAPVLAQEAFMESWHVVATHAQLLPGIGDVTSKYDAWGNFSRTLTPNGFQSERRDLWNGQRTYLEVSPMLNVDKLQGAILMYHSIEDQNVGTDPISSIRMMQALRRFAGGGGGSGQAGA